MSDLSSSALPYTEPGIITILIYSSFLLILNVVNFILDEIISCGLLSQVFIGIAWGTPGGRLFDEAAEDVIVDLGYLGLIMLVYEGGLSTSFSALRANLFLSAGVALTGIAFPIALSYSLMGFVDATPLQAFAAGAALCSTSLGTTFTVMSTSGLSVTRLGVVLTSAAMMDDVVGLVMVQVISNLGNTTTFQASTIIRPIFVSVAFAVVVPLTARFVVLPLTLWLNEQRCNNPTTFFARNLVKKETAFCIHTLILAGLVTGASYAGTSNLFAAYLAGASISWWDTEVAHPETSKSKATSDIQPGEQIPAPEIFALKPESVTLNGAEPAKSNLEADIPCTTTSGAEIYSIYYSATVSRLLKPFFFASIGFSIPITLMFHPRVIWRGIVYATLMALGKSVCGLWLLRFPGWPRISTGLPSGRKLAGRIVAVIPASCRFHRTKATDAKTSGVEVQLRPLAPTNESSTPTQPMNTPAQSPPTITTLTTPSPHTPLSLHPSLILASAMISRGEIGFLISSIASSQGIFTSTHQADGGQEIFLVVTWAILLCTILGPLGVGILVKRVRKLEGRREKWGREAVLGVWGVG